MIDNIISSILKREGGYVNHPGDRGGPTNFGITIGTLSEYLGRKATVQEVKNLTEDKAREIYLNNYVRKPGFGQIKDEKLAGLVVDCGVNHGVSRAIKWLQAAAGVTVDGQIGPVTIAAVNAGYHERIYQKVLAERIKFFGKIITNDPSQAVFAAGWMNRIAEFLG